MEFWLYFWGGREAVLAARRRFTYRLDLPVYFPRFPHLVPREPCLCSPTCTVTEFVHPRTVLTNLREQ
jgi:hypothetical protein